jgi:hypothetical protein
MAKKKKDENRGLLIFAGIGAAALLLAKAGGKKGGLDSKYYTLEDLQVSTTAEQQGISEQFAPVSEKTLENANFYVKNLLDPLSNLLGRRVVVNSWWRHPRTNAAVGGAPDSLHMQALATDTTEILAGQKKAREIIKAVLDGNLPFHKLIFYGSKFNPHTVHISLKRSGNLRRIYYSPSPGKYNLLTEDYVKAALGI